MPRSMALFAQELARVCGRREHLFLSEYLLKGLFHAKMDKKRRKP